MPSTSAWASSRSLESIPTTKGKVGSRLTEFAADHMRRCGMDIAVVETGGDPGHAPARGLYGDEGFTLLPIARYLRLLD